MLICTPTVSTLLTLTRIVTGPSDILTNLGFTTGDVVPGSAADAIRNYFFFAERDRDFSFTQPASTDGISAWFTRQIGSAGDIVTDCKRSRKLPDPDDYYLCICRATCLVFNRRMLDCCGCDPEGVVHTFVFY